MRPSRPVLLLAALSAVLATVTSGCSLGFKGIDTGGDQGYIQGDGVITQVAVADRIAPSAPVEGTTLEGRKVSLADYAGKVVVINVWGSWCPPCRAEADNLAKAARELMPKGVVFLGINTKDNSADNALAFERAKDVPYPSIYDPGGETLLSFHGTIGPNSIPSTLVLDKNGKVAARILGGVTSAQTLVDLVTDASS